MYGYYQWISQALGVLSLAYVCDEDPDERRARLREGALREIDAQILPVVQLKMAMQPWSHEQELIQERELEAA